VNQQRNNGPVVRVEGLRKNYGSVEALKGVSLEVNAGEVFGLLGPNGAGKSTLIKILLGIVKKTDGDAELLGQNAGPAYIRKRVGYLPEDHQFPGYHTGYSLLDFYGQLYGMSASERKAKIPPVLDIVGIQKRMHSKIKTYSKGMKQRLGIASSILHEPDVIFLDEPTDGVDPVGRKEIREIIEDRRRRGATVFVNSHLLGEIEMMCDRVAIMQKGQLIREGTVAELTKQQGVFVLGIVDRRQFPEDEIRQKGYAIRPVGDRFEISLNEGQSIDPVLTLLREKGLNLTHIVEKKQTLEDIFVSMVEAAEPGVDARRKRRQSQRDEYDRDRDRGRDRRGDY
jgi:ABC-2 type transport system ATP-binding protein